MTNNIEYGEYTNEELLQADIAASYACHCPICENQLDYCGSGHHNNCPISEAVYIPR
tara:strand:- start:1204 stop:1374 length:171 start_codon:yes stop_codon:yes gene_type:complete